MSATKKNRLTLGLRVGVLTALALLVLGAAVFLWASSRISGPISVEAAAYPGAGDVSRGETLATQTLICTECHGTDFGGKLVLDSAPGVVIAPNLTSRRSFADWDRAIRHGVAADGRPLVMMPSDGYSRLSLADLRDLVAYLDQLPTVSREMPPTRLSPLGVILAATGALHVPALTLEHGSVDKTLARAPSATNALERGSYLLDVSGCRGCHGPAFEGRSMGPDLPVAPALTRESLEARGQAAFWGAMTQGVRHDGATLHSVMPWRAFSTWPREDLDAVWLALTSPAAPVRGSPPGAER